MVGRLVRDPLPITRGGTGQRSATAAFDALSPLTTLGDILSNDGTNDVRVAVGAADTFLGSTGAAVPSYRTAAQVLTSLGYGVGTFTPTLAFATPGTSSWAYTTQTGIYIKLARLVWVQILLVATPTIGTGAGTVLIGGLPFTPDLTYAALAVVEMNNDWTWPASRTMATGRTSSGVASLSLIGNGSAQDSIVFQASNMTSGNLHTLGLSGCYRTAS